MQSHVGLNSFSAVSLKDPQLKIVYYLKVAEQQKQLNVVVSLVITRGA